MVEGVANRSELIPRIWGYSWCSTPPAGPNGSYVYGHPLSIPPFVVGPSVGNKKPPWAAFAQEGFHKRVVIPSDVRLFWESNLPGSMGRPPPRACGLREECDSSNLELPNLSTVKRPSSPRKPVGSGVRRLSLLRTTPAAALRGFDPSPTQSEGAIRLFRDLWSVGHQKH